MYRTGVTLVLERLNSICERYEELSRLLCDPEVIGDPERLRKVSKEQADLEEIYRAACEYRKVLDQLDEATLHAGGKAGQRNA